MNARIIPLFNGDSEDSEEVTDDEEFDHFVFTEVADFQTEVDDLGHLTGDAFWKHVLELRDRLTGWMSDRE